MDAHLDAQILVREIECNPVRRDKDDNLFKLLFHIFGTPPVRSFHKRAEREQAFPLPRFSFCISVQSVSAKNPHCE